MQVLTLTRSVFFLGLDLGGVCDVTSESGSHDPCSFHFLISLNLLSQKAEDQRAICFLCINRSCLSGLQGNTVTMQHSWKLSKP